METETKASPLSTAALALVGEGATAPELAARFGESGAVVDEAAAGTLLGELQRLGLARVLEAGPGPSRYARTPLGERLLDAGFVGRAEPGDLLVELEQMRTELISTIAHELRTPLTAVRTSVGLLLDPAVETDAAERQTLLETIDRNATRMQRVVGDILDLARFRAGGIQLQLRRFDAAELARSAIASIAPVAKQRGQRVTIKARAEPLSVFGDYRRLEQALVNLLSNAVKHGPEGSPIDVTVHAGDGSVSWAVRDEGPGIKPADQARLFERFFVARRSPSDGAAGVGLGLPITLLIAQAHGGRVEVSSEPRRGSTFTISVPAEGPQTDTGE